MNSTDLRFYLAVFMRRLPLFLVVATLITAAGVYYALTQPAVYRATSNILVQSPRIATSVAYSATREDTFARVQIIKTELLTREALNELADRFDIYPPGQTPTPAEVAEDMRSRIGLEFFGQHELGLAVSFEAGSAVLAAAVANDLAAAILARDAAGRSSRATDTLSFYEDEVERLAASVARIEGRIEAYKTENLQALPDSLEFRRSQQSNLQDRLFVLESEEASLRSRQANYVDLYRASGSPGGPIAQTPESELLDDLRTALTTQRAIFAENSPNIAALQARITALDTELRARQTGDSETLTTQPSPLDVQLADIEDRLRSIELEKSQISSNLAALTRSIEATPAIEVTLKGMEREYENEQSLYSVALTRLAEASIGEQIQTQFMGERLLLLEKATPPEQHIRPRRSLIAIGAAAAGAGLGLAAIVLLEILQGRVHRPVQLQRVLGIEPLATIPYIRTQGQIWRARLLAVAAVALFVAGLPVIQLTLAGNGVDIADLMAAALAGVIPS